MEELKRKSVALSDVIFGLVDRLPDKERLIAYDSINRPLFHGKEINYEGLPERVQDVLIVANYELRKMQSKFENRYAKKSLKEANAFACQKIGNEKERKVSATKKTKPSDYYINNINNNINILNQSISQSVFLGINTQGALLALVEMVKSIKDTAPTEAARLLELVERLSELDGIKVAGEMVSQDQLTTQIKDKLQPFKPSDLAVELRTMFENIDAYRTNDKINYSIVSLYKLKPIYKNKTTQNKSCGYMQRNLTHEQLISVLDDLDKVNI